MMGRLVTYRSELPNPERKQLHMNWTGNMIRVEVDGRAFGQIARL